MSVQNLEERLVDLVGVRRLRFVEYSIVGATGMVVDVGVTTALLASTHYLAANLAGFLIAVSWNFIGNWVWVFDRPDGSIGWQYGSYVALHTVTFGLRALVLVGLIELLGLPLAVATVAGVAVAAVANFLGTEKILGDSLEWFDAAKAVNSAAHAVYASKLGAAARSSGLYPWGYGLYLRLLGAVYRPDRVEVEAGGVDATMLTEAPAEVVSVFHTLEKERPILERFVELVEEAGDNPVVWDVGANLGVFSVLAGQVAEEVVAIEPVPWTVARLADNLDQNGLGDAFVLPVALGAVDESDRPLTIERADVGTQTATFDSELVDGRGELPVEVVVGDHLAQVVPAPDVLKIDVEGAEVAVLDGLATTLQSVDTVLVETHGTEAAVYDRLDRAGFTVYERQAAGQQYFIGQRRGQLPADVPRFDPVAGASGDHQNARS
jgi:FkbM family methyltransferase